MGFVVIRHPQVGVGTCPTESLDLFRANGWVRVSDERAEPSDFHLPDFADVPAPDAPDEQTPAEPDTDEEDKA